MSEVKVKALQPLVDYKTGAHYQTGDVFSIERSEYEIISALAQKLYELAEEEQDNGEIFSNGADA